MGYENPPLIYGLDHQCRALCSQYSDQLPSRFFVGTQSLKREENQIHLLEYQEETNHLSKAVFRHRHGEIWHLTSFGKQPQHLLTCHSAAIYHSDSQQNNRPPVENFFTLWSMPGIDLSQTLNDDTNENYPVRDLDKLRRFDRMKFDENPGKMARVKPDEETEVILMLETKLARVDLETGDLINYISIADQTVGGGSGSATVQTTKSRLSKLSTFGWSPHFNANIVSMVCNSNVYAKDLRTPGTTAWQLSQAHSQLVRDMDYNPNSQHYIATCGDDCEVKFWDVRNTDKPVLNMLHHTHWVWSVRYNSFHDNLVLSSSSDGNVNLLRASSIASQPYGQLLDDDDLFGDDNDNDGNDGGGQEDVSLKRLVAAATNQKQPQQPPKADGLIKTFEDHADSVYAIEWSPNDPWIFASLSYDGRLIINKVPETEKTNILG